MPDINPMALKRVVYELPGCADVSVRSEVPFAGADGQELLLDLYLPAGGASASPLPVVVLVAGYPDPGFSRMLGCRFKDMGSSVSWARLIAASGMAAVTYTNRDPEADVHALIAHLRKSEDALGLDAGRVGVWASSGNAPLALSLLAPSLPAPPPLAPAQRCWRRRRHGGPAARRCSTAT